MKQNLKIILVFLMLNVLMLGAGCRKSALVAAPGQEKAEAKDSVPDNLAQPADITGDMPQFLWSRTRQVNYDVLVKKGVTDGERFRRRIMAWNGKFEGYEGRAILTFGGEEEGPGGPLQEIAWLLWPAQEQKGDAAQKQRQELFAYWDKKLTARYGKDFKVTQTETTESHTWQAPGSVEIEIRNLKDPAKPVQIGLYWTRLDAAKDDQDEEEREREAEEAGEKR